MKKAVLFVLGALVDLAGGFRAALPPVLFIGAIIGVILWLTATASAAEVSPEKQAQLEQHGWTIHDSSEPMVMEAGVGRDCLHPGRARRMGTSIRNWRGDVEVRLRNKLAVCANNGRIVWKRWSVAHAAPGRHWRYVSGPFSDPWRMGRSAGIRSHMEWAFGGVIDSYWRAAVKLTAHVRRGTDHQIWFSAKRRWW